jgi:pyridoxine/pyridoxamine 5'-phosphate oxidase
MNTVKLNLSFLRVWHDLVTSQVAQIAEAKKVSRSVDEPEFKHTAYRCNNKDWASTQAEFITVNHGIDISILEGLGSW